MSVKVYEYAKCDTCRKALKFLDGKGVAYEKIPIVEKPPSMTELKAMLGHLKAEGKTFKNLFNTSGQLYRELGISEKLKAGLSEGEALQLLSKNGKLIKRPFILTGDTGTVGFNPSDWNRIFKK